MREQRGAWIVGLLLSLQISVCISPCCSAAAIQRSPQLIPHHQPQFELHKAQANLPPTWHLHTDAHPDADTPWILEEIEPGSSDGTSSSSSSTTVPESGIGGKQFDQRPKSQQEPATGSRRLLSDSSPLDSMLIVDWVQFLHQQISATNNLTPTSKRNDQSSNAQNHSPTHSCFLLLVCPSC
jgi:hypothetical protein